MELKYLKYKSKYLLLKNNKFHMTGGNIDPMDEEIEKMKKEENEILPDRLAKLSNNWKLHDIKSKGYNLKVAQYDFDNKNDRNLVFCGGFSVNSFCESMEIISSKLERLGKVFKSIYAICLAPFKPKQKNVCMLYDKYSEERLKDRYNENKNEVYVYEGEEQLNNDIAKVISNIILNELKLSHVHLLGKCAGGGVMIKVVSSSKLGDYDALYLAVPGSPMAVKPLLTMDKNILERLHFIFGWNEDDIFKFKWGESKNEIVEYNKLMEHRENYHSFLFQKGGHEIPLELLDKIVDSTMIKELDSTEIDTDEITDTTSNIDSNLETTDLE